MKHKVINKLYLTKASFSLFVHYNYLQHNNRKEDNPSKVLWEILSFKIFN